MSGNMMTFPKTWEEYEEYYGFNDTEQVYTNGSRLIPSFRVQQWLEHVDCNKSRHGKWVAGDNEKIHGESRCSLCNFKYYSEVGHYNYCPNCGAKMKQWGSQSDE